MDLKTALEQLKDTDEAKRIVAIQALGVLVQNRPQQRSNAQRIYCDHLRTCARGPKEAQAVLDILCKSDEDQPFCPSRPIQLQGANLQGADLQMANLERAHLQGAGLKGAQLQWANLKMANLQWADMQGADLQMANLEGANLKDVHLQEADLQMANLERAIVWETTGETDKIPPETLEELEAFWLLAWNWRIWEHTEDTGRHMHKAYILIR